MGVPALPLGSLLFLGVMGATIIVLASHILLRGLAHTVPVQAGIYIAFTAVIALHVMLWRTSPGLGWFSMSWPKKPIRRRRR